MTNTKISKTSYTPLTVLTNEGTELKVKRCSVKDISTLIEIQERLVQAYVKTEGALGVLLSDESIQADLKSMCSLLPLETKKNGEVQYLEFESIEDSWEQIGYLFFNGSITADNRELTDITPSGVSNLHFLPYQKMLREAVQALVPEDS